MEHGIFSKVIPTYFSFQENNRDLSEKAGETEVSGTTMKMNAAWMLWVVEAVASSPALINT